VSAKAEQLFRTLRRFLERPGARTSMEDLANIAVVQLLRHDPSPRLKAQRRDLKREALRLAEEVHDPTDSRQLRHFSMGLRQSADIMEKSRRHHERFVNLGSVESSMEDALAFELRRGLSQDEAMARAVTRVIKERKKGRGTRVVTLDHQDPLRGLLHLASGRNQLPKNDVRVAMAAQKNTPLGQALRDSARFREDVLRDALGEELWGLCRPTGFADVMRRKLLVCVLSSAILQEVTMRKNEVLSRIKRTEGFESVRQLKLYVSDATSLPVY